MNDFPIILVSCEYSHRGSKPSHDKKLRRELNMRVKTLIVNALIAALYFVVTWLIAPFGFTHVQFRASELFNHLIVFNRKFFFGIVLGVFFSNLILLPVKVDFLFVFTHSFLLLLLTMFFARFITINIII